MLTDREFDESVCPFILFPEDKPCERLEWPGAWRTYAFNFHVLLEQLGILVKDNYLPMPELDGEIFTYGVCDSPGQFMERHHAALVESPRLFVVTFTEIRKADQEAEGGWRWCKWGDYIGALKPTTEYLYDEPYITAVWCYSVHELVAEGAK